MRRLIARLERGRDEGFTLIELVMAVSILGLIIVPLVGVVIEYLKISTATRTRMTESTDQQFISTYWQADVSSLGNRPSFSGDAGDPAPSVASVAVGPAGGCGASTGTVIVRFDWSAFAVGEDPDAAWVQSTQSAAYVLVADGRVAQMKRVRCRGGVEDAPLRVAHNIVGAPQVTCEPACAAGTALPTRVSMTFTVQDLHEVRRYDTGYTTTVTADRRQG